MTILGRLVTIACDFQMLYENTLDNREMVFLRIGPMDGNNFSMQSFTQIGRRV